MLPLTSSSDLSPTPHLCGLATSLTNRPHQAPRGRLDGPELAVARTHVANIFQKLEVNGRTSAVMQALQLGIIKM